LESGDDDGDGDGESLSRVKEGTPNVQNSVEVAHYTWKRCPDRSQYKVAAAPIRTRINPTSTSIYQLKKIIMTIFTL
jgi:hypothetical protein